MKKFVLLLVVLAVAQAERDWNKIKPRHLTRPVIGFPELSAGNGEFIAVQTESYLSSHQDEINWSNVKSKHLTKPVKDVPRFTPGNSRIVGGQEATPHQFPYQVGMLLDTEDLRFFCGGSLISPNYILTAAHCTEGGIVWVEAILAAHNIEKREPEQQRIIMEKENLTIIIHPEWDPIKMVNDLALIKLPYPVTYNDYIQPLKLPVDLVGQDLAGQIATVSGWGKTSDNSGGTTDKLRYVQTPIISNEECSSYFVSLPPTNICVDGTQKKGPCDADSGGPVTLDVNGEKQQVGIVSFGSPYGCEAGWPSGFTRVTAFLDWIKQNSDA